MTLEKVAQLQNAENSLSLDLLLRLLSHRYTFFFAVEGNVCFFTQQEEFWCGKLIIEVMSKGLSMIQSAVLSHDSFKLRICHA